MKKLLKLIGKYKIFLGFSVIFAAISVVLQLYVPVLFGDVVLSKTDSGIHRDIGTCYLVHESFE